MATKPIGAESALVTNPLTFTLTPGMAPAAPLMRMLSRYDRAKVKAFVEISISLLDLMDGDADSESNGDDEPTGDELDAAYTEWRPRRPRFRADGSIVETFTDSEDDEDDDASEDDDPGGCEHDGREPEDGF